MKGLTRNVILQKEDSVVTLKIFILIFAFTFIDLFSKFIYLNLLGMEKNEFPLLEGYVNWFVTPHLGHTFTLFSKDIYNHLLTIFFLLFITLLFVYPLFFKIKKIAIFCLTMIVAGGLGNLIDKAYNYNATNIFCSIQQSSGYNNICFNIADFYVSIGVTLGLIFNFYYIISHYTDKKHIILLWLLPISLGIFVFCFRWLVFAF
jgi:signal peptidase II